MTGWGLYDRGLSLFPLRPFAKTTAPGFKWKGFRDQRATPDQIAVWARSDSNIGVACGPLSGVVVLDCDDTAARAAVETRGLPDTFTVRTPRGTHFYFQHPGWVVGNRSAIKWPGHDVPGVDLRGDRGLSVAPGSYYEPTVAERAAGKVAGPYEIERDLPFASMPDWLAEITFPKGADENGCEVHFVDESTEYGRKALHAICAEIAGSQPGARSDKIYASTARIGNLVSGGEIQSEEAWEAVHEACRGLGLDDDDPAWGNISRAWEKGIGNPQKAPERPAPVDLLEALGSRPLRAEEDVPPPPAPTYGPGRVPATVGPNEIQEYFRNCVLIGQRNEMFTPSGVLLKPAQFDALYGGPVFYLDDGDSKNTRSAWEMFTKNSHTVMPKAAGACFRPELASGTIIHLEGLPYVNIYVPVVTRRVPGDVTPFLDLVRKMLPVGDDADILLHWMASAVQNPGKKFFWWPVIQGTKGNGKTALLEIMFNAIGERYSHHVNADSVLKTGNQFNDWLVGKLFLGFEEIHSSDGNRHFVEMMKSTVTNTRIATEGKGVGQTTSDNRANGMMLTNWKNACPIDDDERRWGVFFTAQQKAEDLTRDGMSGEYFPIFYEWLRSTGQPRVTHFLANMPLQAALDPARGLHRAPRTSSTAEAIMESRGSFEQEILEAIEEGRVGFSAEVIAGSYVKNLARDMRKTIPAQRFTAILESVGYRKHPALASNKGRVPGALSDGGRPVLYFHADSPILRMTEPSEIRDAVNMAIFPAQVVADNVVPLRR